MCRSKTCSHGRGLRLLSVASRSTPTGAAMNNLVRSAIRLAAAVTVSRVQRLQSPASINRLLRRSWRSRCPIRLRSEHRRSTAGCCCSCRPMTSREPRSRDRRRRRHAAGVWRGRGRPSAGQGSRVQRQPRRISDLEFGECAARRILGSGAPAPLRDLPSRRRPHREAAARPRGRAAVGVGPRKSVQRAEKIPGSTRPPRM